MPVREAVLILPMVVTAVIFKSMVVWQTEVNAPTMGVTWNKPRDIPNPATVVPSCMKRVTVIRRPVAR